MNYKKKAENDKTTSYFSVASIFSGSLSALFGIEFGIYLTTDETQKNNTKMAMLADRFAPGQKQMVDLVKAADIQLKAGQYEGVKKTCHMINSLLKELYRETVSAADVYPMVAQAFYRLMIHIGDGLFDKGASKDALSFYLELLAYFPEDKDLLKKIARMNYTMGLPGLPEAERYYRKAQRLDPDA